MMFTEVVILVESIETLFANDCVLISSNTANEDDKDSKIPTDFVSFSEVRPVSRRNTHAAEVPSTSCGRAEITALRISVNTNANESNTAMLFQCYL